MRVRKLFVGLLVGGLLAACGNQTGPLSTNASTPTDRPASTETMVEVTVIYLDADDEYESSFEFASAKEPVIKGERLIMAGTDVSLSFKIIDFVRGEQALATIATIDPAYAGLPAGYEVGLVRAEITHGNVRTEPVVFDGSMIALLVLTNGEYQPVKDQQGLPCCFEPRFDTPVAKGDQLEVYFPILVATDDPNPLLVINRDQSDNEDARHFALQ
ncbi:MAG TPA: hypothetical protein DEF47_04165 [Herpetosiphon sp.]|uniref:Lipoprotein n=1 Tax=Herpetosiphon aurantiacus (strain ATCC 23779 / DSM 785 / 114-95) TaxID=316274 RepID=A9AZI4_HERA2|nr:hypothetical protein [Herpetosiphon sp.]ABX05128.1 hypothetical protein Haur_2490 [Herpetosiphon aurantiacus DSM 785]HBW49083.1 hypothetical protein [Herpetosiphon sp.]